MIICSDINLKRLCWGEEKKGINFNSSEILLKTCRFIMINIFESLLHYYPYTISCMWSSYLKTHKKRWNGKTGGLLYALCKKFPVATAVGWQSEIYVNGDADKYIKLSHKYLNWKWDAFKENSNFRRSYQRY